MSLLTKPMVKTFNPFRLESLKRIFLCPHIFVGNFEAKNIISDDNLMSLLTKPMVKTFNPFRLESLK